MPTTFSIIGPEAEEKQEYDQLPATTTTATAASPDTDTNNNTNTTNNKQNDMSLSSPDNRPSKRSKIEA